jgi:hypothetical protein
LGKHPRYPVQIMSPIDQTYLLSVISMQAYDVYEEGAKRGHFLSRMQRSLYNAQSPLRAKPFWRPDETPYENSMKYGLHVVYIIISYS